MAGTYITSLTDMVIVIEDNTVDSISAVLAWQKWLWEKISLC